MCNYCGAKRPRTPGSRVSLVERIATDRDKTLRLVRISLEQAVLCRDELSLKKAHRMPRTPLLAELWWRPRDSLRPSSNRPHERVDPRIALPARSTRAPLQAALA